MIDERIKLEVHEDNNGSFTDHSENAVDFLRDTITTNLAVTTDYLYLGFRKPINAVYVELNTANTNAAELTVETWDGSSWVEVSSRDETKGFTRSGFITWVRQPAVASASRTTINGVTGKEWVRISTDVTHSATVVSGINLVFSDDEMLRREFPNINDSRIIPSGQSSHIINHVASRNLIVQTLRNEGYLKYNSTSGFEMVTQWDLHDIYEIREAATYLCLSKIFFILSDSTEDNWWQKHLQYSKLYDDTFTRAKVSLDLDDDGNVDANEDLPVRRTARFTR